MVKRTKAEAQATREAVLDAAEFAFLERGVSRCSLEEIARRARVTRGAIYWHFRNKADLFDAMLARVRQPLDDLCRALQRPCPDTSLDALRAMVVSTLRRLATDTRHQRVYTIIFHRCERVPELRALLEREDAMVAEAHRALREYFIRAEALGLLRAGVSADDAVEGLRAYVVGLFTTWLRDPARYDLEAKAGTLVSMFLDGLGANPASRGGHTP